MILQHNYMYVHIVHLMCILYIHSVYNFEIAVIAIGLEQEMKFRNGKMIETMHCRISIL